MAVRPIDANELYRIEKLLDTDIVRQDKVALNLLEQVLYDIQHMPALTPPPITGDTSDGYHTFNELYHHRAILFSVICNERPDIAWKSKRHHDGTMYDGMFIVGIDTPEGQATYHYDIEPYWSMFRVKELELAPEWDGHTPDEAIQRIGTLTPPNEPCAGLYEKYTVYKNKDGSLVTDCFILRPAKDPAAVAALRAYAAATDNAELAADIINWVGAEPNEPLTLEQLREMDGEPVYVVPANKFSELGKWCVLSVDDSDDYSCALVPGIDCWGQRFEAYGEQWTVYRRPPEEEI